jgi:hypothetical protein
MSDDPFEYATPLLKIIQDMTAIPRAHYEALIRAHYEALMEAQTASAGHNKGIADAISRCATLLSGAAFVEGNPEKKALLTTMAARIRALAHTDESIETDDDLPTAEDVRGILKPESKTEAGK